MNEQLAEMIEPGSTIGIIGGGQLGRMMALSAANLGYRVVAYAPEEDCPASHVVSHHICADYEDEEQLLLFAECVDVITLEFENIPHRTLQILSEKVQVYPYWEALYIAQNRIREKDFLNDIEAATTEYVAVKDIDSLQAAIRKFGFPVILKTCEMGYDGKGQYLITEHTDITSLWKEAHQAEVRDDIHWICEQYVPFAKEISVVVARSSQGEVLAYDPSENMHKDGVLRTSHVPAVVTRKLSEKAKETAVHIVETLGYIGVLAVEYFVTRDDELLVNEIAPRPHNSGHWTMDACVTSQFEQHVRAVCGLPLGAVDVLCDVEMQNLIGDDVLRWQREIEKHDVKLHLYGKKDVKAGRKMGHINRLLIKNIL